MKTADPKRTTIQKIIRDVAQNAPSQMQADIKRMLKRKTENMTFEQAFAYFEGRGIIHRA